jgi:hypothetical protein
MNHSARKVRLKTLSAVHRNVYSAGEREGRFCGANKLQMELADIDRVVERD